MANRSSGRVGVALAEVAAERGHRVTLLLGPTPRTPSDSRVRVRRFQTTAELEGQLSEELGSSDVLVMAAAVADYRPVVDPAELARDFGKLRRRAEGFVLRMEPTPDLLAGCSARKRAGQVIVGFALEPRERMLTSARAKLEKKGLDLIVANPKETMESELIEAVVLDRGGGESATGGAIEKRAFAGWLLERIEAVSARESRG